MEDLPEDPDREEIRAFYESSDDPPASCWENYGDADPAPHGGDWIHYGGGWKFVGTFVAADMGYPMGEFDVDDPVKAQYVYSSSVHWGDIVTKSGRWTGAMQNTVDSLHGAPESPAAAVVNNRLTWLVAAFADEHRREQNPHKPVRTGDYDDILSAAGVEPCDDE